MVKLFERLPEEPKTQLIVQLTQAEKDALKRMADQANTSMTDIVLRSLAMYARKNLPDLTATDDLARNLHDVEETTPSQGTVHARKRRAG